MPDGRPNLNGIWQALNTAELRRGGASGAARDGDAPWPGDPRPRLGGRRIGSRRLRSCQSVGGPVPPYNCGRPREEARESGQRAWTRDPSEIKFFEDVSDLHGCFPFQIFQSDKAFFIALRIRGCRPQHLSEGSRSTAGRFVEGGVVLRTWGRHTLVIEENQRIQRSEAGSIAPAITTAKRSRSPSATP